MTRPHPLRPRLRDYDGTHTEALESLATEFGAAPSGIPPEVWDEIVELSLDEEGRLAAGATWLLRRWVEEGHPPPSAALNRLGRRLGEVTDKWARLHLVQAIPSLPIPTENLPAWAELCRKGTAAEAPFLRAWSVNGLVHLATLDPGLRSESDAALAAALSDPKASVRARARKILESG